jgi:hypothetical protein
LDAQSAESSNIDQNGNLIDIQQQQQQQSIVEKEYQVNQLKEIDENNSKLMKKVIKYIIEEQKLFHKNTIEIDVRTYYQYCLQNIKFAKNMVNALRFKP